MTNETRVMFAKAMDSARQEGCDIMVLSFDPCHAPSVEAFSTMERKKVSMLAREALGLFAEEPQSPIITN